MFRSCGSDVGAEAHRLLAHAPLHHLLQALERAAADEQDVLGVHLDVLLLRVLPSALRRDVRDRAFEDFQSACCTPSPETSRVIEGFSDLREILSSSST